MKLTEIIKCNRELGSSLSGNKYKIIVLSNITINQIKEILEFNLRGCGLNADVEIGNYNLILQDSIDLSEFNAVIVFWELCNLVENLHVKCNSMSQELYSELKDRADAEIKLLSTNLKNTSLVLINRFSALAFDGDPLGGSQYKRLCKHLNKTLEINFQGNNKIVDLDMVIANTGLDEAIDYRQYQITKALYSLSFYKQYVDSIKPAFSSATGQIKKLIILDCDNTLWKGVLGEDGEDGIQMSQESISGIPYFEIQNIIKSYRESGILLALCSKNNLNDVEQVLMHHPDMILKEEDFVVKKINWDDKVKNISEIATELNLGLDSFIFIDDSDFEIGMVKQELPQVKCIQVPTNASDYPAVIRGLVKEFDLSRLTAEDRQKTKMYQQDKHRNSVSSQFDSVDDYLSSLNMNVNVLWGADIPVSRASQLSQKTNQFNLTTRRYSESDIQRMLDDDTYALATFSVTDQYGDYGITGLIIIKLNLGSESYAIIDSFLMSCRIIGRNVEYAVFYQIIKKLNDLGVNKLKAEYLTTPKSKLVEKFYDALGLKNVFSDDACKKYTINLNGYKSSGIGYIKTISEG